MACIYQRWVPVGLEELDYPSLKENISPTNVRDITNKFLSYVGISHSSMWDFSVFVSNSKVLLCKMHGFKIPHHPYTGL